MNDNNPPANWADRAVGFGAGLATALLFAVSTRGTGFAMALAYFSPAAPDDRRALGFSPLGRAGRRARRRCVAHRFAGISRSASPGCSAFGAPALSLATLARRAVPSNGRSGASATYVTPGALLAATVALSIIARRIGVAILDPALSRLRRRADALMTRFETPALDEVGPNMRTKCRAGIRRRTRQAPDLAERAGGRRQPRRRCSSPSISGWRRASWKFPAGCGGPGRRCLKIWRCRGLSRRLFAHRRRTGFHGRPRRRRSPAPSPPRSGLCLALQGLATLHALTRDNRFRGCLLSALYAVVFVLEPWSLLLLALFGLVESAFNLRARRARRLSIAKSEAKRSFQ